MSYSSLWALQAEMSQEILLSLHRELAGHFTEPRAFFLENRETPQPAPPYEMQNGVAVIRISGVIDRVARISFFTGLPYTEGQNRIREALEAALADGQVKSILLSLNSPGGTAAGTKELADFIAASAGQKPLAAYADGLCASAAYWLAAATGKVFAPVTAQVGSIGVIAVLTDWTKATEKAGLVRTVLASGMWKAAGSPDKSLTDEERDLFLKQLTTLHSIFKADVAVRMGISASESQWAEGQTILGAEAQKLGLVSAIVRDEAEAAALLAANTEDNMDLGQLKAAHPELAAAIAKETREQMQAETQTAAANARNDMLAFVKAIAGQEIAAKVETLAKSGISAAQLEALAPMLFPQQGQAAGNSANGEELTRSQMLDAITRATGQPLPAGAIPSGKNALIADAERRANTRQVI